MVIAFVALSLLGIGAIPLLKVNLSPSKTSKSLNISYSLPQSSPDIVERLATSPLENIISEISGIEKIYSISRYNGGQISLTLDEDVDLSFKKFEVSTAIRNAYLNLPEQLSYPLVTQSGGEDQKNNSPILIYAVNAPYAASKIQTDIEELIKNPLSQINELESIELTGGNSLQVSIAFDYQKMLRYGLSKSDIQNALKDSNNTSYIGLSDIGNGQQFFLYTSGDKAKVEQLENIRIARLNGQEILLKEMADVYLEESKPNRYRRINGQNAIYLNLTARKGVNKLVLADQVKTEIQSLASQLPKGYELRLEVDDTEQLNEELQKIYLRSSLSFSILLVFILLTKRNGRYLIALFMGLIVNLCITAIVIYGLGVELHLYSIAGLTISFGLIVDNAIVMMDHMHKFKNRKVFLALMAASLTTILALLMVMLLPEEDRLTLTDFSIIVAINLGVSLFIALFFTPAIYQVLFGRQIPSSKPANHFKRLRRYVRLTRGYITSIGFIVRYRKAFLVVLILGFGLPVFKMPLTWEGQEWYNKTIGSDTYQDGIRPITDKIFGGALRKFVNEVYEGYAFRSIERTRLMVTARLPFGTTLDDTNYAILTIEGYLSTVEGIDKYVSSVTGRSGRIEITFLPEYNDSALPYQLKGRLQARALDLTGVRWSVTGVGRGFGVGGENTDRPNYRIRMKGYNYDELERQANILAKMLVDKNNRVQEVKTNEQIGYGRERTSEYVLAFDPSLMARSGYSRGEVLQTLNDLAPSNRSGSSANFKGEQLPIVINANTSDQFSKWDLMQEPLAIDSTKRIKIKDYAGLVFEETANELHKEDRQYLRILAFDYLGSGRFGSKYLEASLDTMASILPVGYTAKASSYYFGSMRAQRQYGLLGFLILGVFFICAILFENLRQPFYIIATIPISFIGLFLIFALLDFRFDQGGYAAFVLLGGLVVNAAIFVVNDLNNARSRNYNRAVIKAVLGKAQPIILTALSTCFGLIPFLLEGDSEIFWFALAIGTIGGLLFSLFAVFVCLPVFLMRLKLIKK